jgi:helix-turn-helix protein
MHYQDSEFSINENSINAALARQGWIRTDQVADYLGTSPNNIRNMIYRGRLFPKKFFGRWYFKREDIDLTIESSSR